VALQLTGIPFLFFGKLKNITSREVSTGKLISSKVAKGYNGVLGALWEPNSRGSTQP
jgi:hypothetical protein